MTQALNRYNEDRPLPYWVRLSKIEGDLYGKPQDSMQTLIYLDLRGLEFTRASSARLARVFDWLVRGFKIRQDDVVDHCLIITPLDPDQDFQVLDTGAGRRPENWPVRRGEAFRWVPIAFDHEDQSEVQYAWQK
jgi:hypothetical protein